MNWPLLIWLVCSLVQSLRPTCVDHHEEWIEASFFSLIENKMKTEKEPHSDCISLLLPRLPKLSGPFEKHWLGNLGSLSSCRETQPVHWLPTVMIFLCVAAWWRLRRIRHERTRGMGARIHWTGSCCYHPGWRHRTDAFWPKRQLCKYMKQFWSS